MYNVLLYVSAMLLGFLVASVIYIAINLGPCLYWFQVGEHKMYLSGFKEAQTYFDKNKKSISDTHFLCEIKGAGRVIKAIF